ncbi:hypothetical protein [Neobacillus sp. NPDC093127]|uniref:hypothetical protein n=1 Tax=Neobacillus sp. NPDC093127 TaxID=3364296 RepID=UPI003828AA98
MNYTWFFSPVALEEEDFSQLKSRLKLREEDVLKLKSKSKEEDALKSKEEDVESFKRLIKTVFP